MIHDLAVATLGIKRNCDGLFFVCAYCGGGTTQTPHALKRPKDGVVVVLPSCCPKDACLDRWAELPRSELR